MRALRPPTGRRQQRPVRVVKVEGGGRRPPLMDGEARAFRTGLEAAQLLKRLFPDFFAEHVAVRVITLEGQLGVLSAFLQLVEQRGLPLRLPEDGPWGGDTEIDRADTPVETLGMFNWVDGEYLADLGYWIWQPRPRYYGIGVESVLEEWHTVDDPLTLTLWHLFRHTEWGIGVDLPALMHTSGVAEEIAERILRLKTLPSDTSVYELALELEVPEATGLARRGDLLAYAFGKPENTLARCTDYEVEAVHMGDTDEWEWASLDELIVLALEAQLIESSYRAWGQRIACDPYREIPRLAGALHKAARRLRARDARSERTARTLIDILGPAGTAERIAL